MNIRQSLADIFDLNPKKTPLSKGVNNAIYIIILLSATAVILETVKSLAHWRSYLELFEDIVLALFALELIFRLSVTDLVFKRHQSVGERLTIVFYTVIDLISVLPPIILLLNLDQHFDYFTSLRLLRLFKLFRHDHSVEFIIRAVMKKKVELFKSAILVIIFTLFLSVVLYEVENDFERQQTVTQTTEIKEKSKFTDIVIALVWALDIFTDETSGYADFKPVTLLGKIIAGLIGFMKIGIVIIPTGIIASGFIEVIAEEKVNDKYDILCAAFRKRYNEQLDDYLYEEPHTMLTIKNALNISEADFYTILQQKHGFRIRSVLSSSSERYNDTNLLEFYGFGDFTAYGIKNINPDHQFVLIAPNNFEEKGMSYFSYCLSVALKADMVFNEIFRHNSMHPDFDYNYIHNVNYFNYAALDILKDKKTLKTIHKPDKAFLSFMNDLRHLLDKGKIPVLMLIDKNVESYQVCNFEEAPATNDLMTWLKGSLNSQKGIVVRLNPNLPDRDLDITTALAVKNEILSIE